MIILGDAMTDVVQLNRAQTARLEKLAKAAGRTPQDMLRFVLADGFEYNEYVVTEVNKALAEESATFTTDEVFAAVEQQRAKRAKKQPQAA